MIELYSAKFVADVKAFAIKTHADTNHFYDGNLPYDFHLAEVVKEATKHLSLIRRETRDAEFFRHQNILATCWLHDTMEDCRLNYNAILKFTNEHSVAEMVRAVTNYGRGRTREERMPDWIYEEIRNTFDADFVKIADRLANVRYSKYRESRMFEVYRKENNDFITKVTKRHDVLAPMLKTLSDLFN